MTQTNGNGRIVSASAKSSPDDTAVIVDRGGIVENKHQIHVAITDANGKLLYSIGDPDRLTLVRSAIKPAQALAIVETGALEKFGIQDDADLALMCASHNGEPDHVSRARNILTSGGNCEADLKCGAHPSILPAVNNQWASEGFKPTPVWSNCSGKHSGMLAAARALGADIATYHELQNPLQQRVARVVEDLTGLSPEEIPWAIDGCNMAAPALPLHQLATVTALFAQAADKQESSNPQEDSVSTNRSASMARIFNAMVKHPRMVAGTDRFCTALMQAYEGLVIGKVGADACYGLGVRSCDSLRALGIEGALGLSIKVEDGNLDILYGAIPELLHRLNIGTPAMRQKLDNFHKKPVTTTSGVIAGSMSYPFVLRSL